MTIEEEEEFALHNTLKEEQTLDELANEAKQAFKEAAKHLKPKKQKKQKWISDETISKIEERRLAKKNGQHHEGYKKIAKEVKQLIKRDKKEYIEKNCKEIELNFAQNKTRQANNITKNMTKTFQPRSGVIKDENGVVLTES